MTEVPAHGDEPLGFRVGKGQAVAAYHVGGGTGQPEGAGTSGTVALVDVANVLDLVSNGHVGGALGRVETEPVILKVVIVPRSGQVGLADPSWRQVLAERG